MRYLTKGREIAVRTGETVYKEGDSTSAQEIFFVVAGTIKLVRKMRDGAEFVYVCGPEDIFGAVSAIASAQREETAFALEDCRIYVWSRTNFEACASLYIEFARMAIQNMSRYLRAINREIGRLSPPESAPRPTT